MMHNTLRHIFLQALLFPLVLLVLSCEKEQDKGNDTVILTLQVQLPDVQQTKATVAADDSRNENVLSWIDVFLFSGDGGSGTEVYRTPYKSITPTQDALDPSIYTVSVPISSARLVALFGTDDPGIGNSRTAKIAVVGNGDAVTDDGYYMAYPSAATSSVQGIRESVATTNFDAWYAENLSYLICCGTGTVTLTHTASPDEIKATGTIPITRAYAKLDLELELPPSGQLEVAGRIYQANLSTMTIEMLNVVRKGYVGSDETHIRTCGSGDFVSTSDFPRALTAQGNPLVATHNCFYSYPRRFSDVPENKMVYRVKIDWKATDATVDDPVHTGYYTFPVVDEENVSVLYANHYYHTEAGIHTLGSPNPAAPEELEGSWSILPWGTAPVYGTFNDYEYLIGQPTWINMHGLTTGTAHYKSSSSLTRWTVTSVRMYAVDRDGSGNDDGRDIYTDITDSSVLSNYTLTHNSDANTITLNHPLTGMYFRQEISVVLENANGLSETIIFEQTPPIEVRSTGHQGGQDNFFIDGFKMGEGTSLNQNDYRRPPDSNTAMALKYNLRFKVSAFTSENNTYLFGNPSAYPEVRHQYIIGDPRVTQTKYSESDFRASGSYQWTKTQLDKILIADTRISGADWIAPEFITCSGYARAPKLSLAQLEMRAAMYQESGYPAGRWRLMTEAEYKFLLNLQLNDIIPTFFYEVDNNGDAPYFTAQGTCFEINQGGASYRMISPAPATAYARFVYDTWYWGPDPVPAAATTYTPMP